LEIVLILWIWPYSHIIALAFVALVVVCCTCLATYGVALTWHGIGILAARRQREYFSRRYIVAGNVVVFHQEDNDPRNLSAEQESAKLALPAPRDESQNEESQPLSEDGIDHWRILELAGKGMDLRSVALACNTSYYHVQRITSAWKKKLKEGNG